MPIYRIRQVRDTTTCQYDARSPEEAIAVFSELFGISLTLKEGPTAPNYTMGRVELGPHWGQGKLESQSTKYASDSPYIWAAVGDLHSLFPWSLVDRLVRSSLPL
jgi:hypothetical protein